MSDFDNQEWLVEEEHDSVFGSYVRTTGPEIIDARLSLGARLLKLWLRFRSMDNNKNNYVTAARLAADFNVSSRTIERWLSELRDVDILRCETNKANNQTKKILKAPWKTYGEEFTMSFRNLLRRDAPIEQLRCMHLSAPADRPTQMSAPPTDTDVGSSTADRPTQMSVPPTDTDVGLNRSRSLKVDETEKVEEPHHPIREATRVRRLDGAYGDTSYPLQPHPSSDTGDPFPYTKKPRKPVENNFQVRDDDRINQVRQIAADAEKAAGRLRSAAVVGTTSSPDGVEKLTRTKNRTPKQRRNLAPGKIVEEWWMLSREAAYPDLPREGWDKKEFEIANKLLETYGDELLKSSIDELFKSWDWLKNNTIKWIKDDFPTLRVFYDQRLTIVPALSKKMKEATASLGTPDRFDF